VVGEFVFASDAVKEVRIGTNDHAHLFERVADDRGWVSEIARERKFRSLEATGDMPLLNGVPAM